MHETRHPKPVSGTTLRDGVGRALGGGFRMGETCTPMADSYKVKVKVKVKSLSRVRLFATPWTVAYQAPQSTEFSRQEYWSGLPFPSPGDFPNPGIEPRSPVLQADTLSSKPPDSCKCMAKRHYNIVK